MRQPNDGKPQLRRAAVPVGPRATPFHRGAGHGAGSGCGQNQRAAGMLAWPQADCRATGVTREMAADTGTSAEKAAHRWTVKIELTFARWRYRKCKAEKSMRAIALCQQFSRMRKQQ